MARYVEGRLLAANPFETLDQAGVGQLVRWACQRGRDARLDLKLGICGEHGGDPASVEFCHHVGLDYVSCSPFRIPLARRRPRRPRRHRPRFLRLRTWQVCGASATYT